MGRVGVWDFCNQEGLAFKCEHMCAERGECVSVRVRAHWGLGLH